MLISIAQAQMYVLALTRIMAILIQVPVLGGELIPNQVRIGLGLLLTAILIPWQPLPPEAEALPLFALFLAIAKELLIGTLAGFAAKLVFSVFQIAGEMMATATGFGAGRTLNPTLGDTSTAMDQLFVMTAMLLFLVIDGHHSFLAALQRTFVVLPINSSLPAFNANQLLSMTAQMIASGIQLSLPVVGALLLADIILGLLARVAPQVQVFFLGLPLKVGLGLFAMAMTLAVIFPAMRALLRDIGPRMLELLAG